MIRRTLPVLLALAACEPATVRVAGVTLDLFTPSEAVDPLEGADVLLVEVIDAGGQIVAEGSARPGEPLPLPPITDFGPVEVVVTARATGGAVLSAARSGPLTIREGDERSLALLFLPVNQAVPLDWRPNAHRVGHAALPIGDGEVLLVGGREPDANRARGDTEIWSTETGFGGDGPILASSMADAGVARLEDGSWILAGGITGSTTSALAVHVAADGSAITALPNLPAPEDAPCLAAHPRLGVFVLGRNRSSLYTPRGQVGQDSTPWGELGGCSGQDGSLLLAGGDRWGLVDLTDEGVEWPVDFESTTTWFPDLPQLSDMQVLALSDGRFWAAGGQGFEVSASARIADPSRREIVEGPALASPRQGGEAAAWRQDRVVLAGGWSDASRDAPVRSVDIHDPDEGPVLSVQVPVAEPSLTVLTGGAVLLTGGLDPDGQPAGAFGVMPWPDDG